MRYIADCIGYIVAVRAFTSTSGPLKVWWRGGDIGSTRGIGRGMHA